AGVPGPCGNRGRRPSVSLRGGRRVPARLEATAPVGGGGGALDLLGGAALALAVLALGVAALPRVHQPNRALLTWHRGRMEGRRRTWRRSCGVAFSTSLSTRPFRTCARTS